MTFGAVVFDAYGTLYDVQSVAAVTGREYPRHGGLIAQLWRLKQLEYTWLRSQMGAYRDFWEVSEESLRYALDVVGAERDAGKLARIMDSYLHLDPYPDAADALDALSGTPRVILSNGTRKMLDALVANTGLEERLEAIISVDEKRLFKPSPAAYDLVGATLGLSPGEVLFVSSNSFDAVAAKRYGFRVAWIERVSAAALQAELRDDPEPGPTTLFKLLRMREERLGIEVDHRLGALTEIAALRLS